LRQNDKAVLATRGVGRCYGSGLLDRDLERLMAKKAPPAQRAASKRAQNVGGRDRTAGSAKRPSKPSASRPMSSAANVVDGGPPERVALKTKAYLPELGRLQVELVKLQEWIRHEGLKVVVVFEGRDAAGKGGVIKTITQSLNPRVCRVVALAAPTEREKTQWYFQRYVAHLPAAGEMVLFDRSWYNRAGVERVMGFCTEEEYQEFLRSCPEFERMLLRSGIILVKYWFSVSDAEQERRFQARINDPTKRWKLSPMDVQSRSRWLDYSNYVLVPGGTPHDFENRSKLFPGIDSRIKFCLLTLAGGQVAHTENKRGDQRGRSLFGPVRLARQHHKARGVVGLVLDILGQDADRTVRREGAQARGRFFSGS